MRLNRRVALNGVQLDEIHERVVVRGIDTSVPSETVNAVSRMGGAGQRMTNQHWDVLEVRVTFAIDVPKKETLLRREIWEAVMAWAVSGGWLTVSYLENRRMWAEKVVFPSSGDLWNWTEDYTITFRAYGIPFWQEEAPSTVERDVYSGGTVIVPVNGNVDTVLDVSFLNQSGVTIPSFAVTANGQTLQLTGIALAANETLIIGHDKTGLLYVTAGGRSVYSCLSGDDDLTVSPGTVSVRIMVPRAGHLTVSSYGRYL